MTNNTVDTIVISDTHLTELEHNAGLWRKYNQPKYSPDIPLSRLLKKLTSTHPKRTFRLVFNGDTFDFDQVHILSQERKDTLSWSDTWEKLKTTQDISVKKIQCILQEHDTLTQSLAEFIEAGHSIIFVRGNHDIELTWQEVKNEIFQTLKKHLSSSLVPIEQKNVLDRVEFHDWFYYEPHLFFIEHGNQYDPNTNVPNFLTPFLQGGKQIELNAGSIGSRIVTRRLGFFNPYLEEQFVLSGLGYIRHYYKYIRPHKKDFLKTWVVGSILGIRAMIRLPFALISEQRKTNDEKAHDIAKYFQVSEQALHKLIKLQPPTLTRNIRQVMATLQMDKAAAIAILTLILVVLGAINFLFTIHYVSTVFDVIALADIAILLWIMFVKKKPSRDNFADIAEKISEILDVPYVVLGHLHNAGSKYLQDGKSMYLNEGTWAPAFYDVECTKPLEHRQSFIWFHDGKAKLYQWENEKWTEHQEKIEKK